MALFFLSTNFRYLQYICNPTMKRYFVLHFDIWKRSKLQIPYGYMYIVLLVLNLNRKSINWTCIKFEL
jgi:hypothetical protein